MWRPVFILVLSVLNGQSGLSKLEAISMIESGNNDFAIGEAGEVSRYQILPRVWKRFTTSMAYSDEKVSSSVAAQYLQVLEANFRTRTGRQPSDFDRYVLWNGGPGYYERIGFVAARVHPIIRERAQRFVNLRQMRSVGGLSEQAATSWANQPSR
jgi:hypothetical protein